MKIRFLGPIERPPAKTVADVEATFGSGTVRTLLLELGFSSMQVNFLSVIRDNLRLSPDEQLAADDEITVMLLVGGG